jgi:coenzyme F420-reducing hydrogenase alpha subunit
MGNITLNHITKVEGHAKLTLEVDNGKLKTCELGSIEGSRYFEGLLKGRKWNEPQEIATRICGICSSAHNVAAIMAMETCLGVQASEQTVALRQLQTIGERIRSHAAHLYFLALPDYLGYKSALEMAPKFKNEVARALRLMKLGNDMVRLITGRVIHPISPTIGGFLHFPKQAVLDEIRDRLDKSHEDVLETNKLIASLEYPDFTRETQFMSIVKDDEFGTSHGQIKIGDKVYEQSQFHDFVKEYHEPFSSANFCVREDKAYYVGALARFNNNIEKLSPETKKYMKKLPMKFPSLNPFHNNMCQALELIHYREECIKLLDKFKVQHEEIAHIEIKEGHGIAANEAPRGTLWHEYKTDSQGIITYANILTPTAQFLRNLNEDIAAYVQQLLDKKASKEVIVKEIEKLIRSYDPCFSCSSHFLKVKWI